MVIELGKTEAEQVAADLQGLAAYVATNKANTEAIAKVLQNHAEALNEQAKALESLLTEVKRLKRKAKRGTDDEHEESD